MNRRDSLKTIFIAPIVGLPGLSKDVNELLGLGQPPKLVSESMQMLAYGTPQGAVYETIHISHYKRPDGRNSWSALCRRPKGNLCYWAYDRQEAIDRLAQELKKGGVG